MNRFRIVCSVLAFLAGTAAFPQQPPAPIHVNVNLVNLEVVVLQKNGRPVTNLDAKNFRVTVCPTDGTYFGKKEKKSKKERKACTVEAITGVQHIGDLPILFKVLVDTSGSTDIYLDQFSKKAARSIWRIFLRGRTDMKTSSENQGSIDQFYDTRRRVLDWSSELDAPDMPLKSLKASGDSAILDSIFLTAAEARSTWPQVPNATKLLFTITDGIDNMRFPRHPDTKEICLDADSPSRQETTDCHSTKKEDVVIALQEAGVVLYVIDFSKRYDSPYQSSVPNPPFNAQLELGEIAEASGGERILVKNVKEATRALSKMVDHVSSRYTLSFTPTQTDPGWYEVSVEIDTPDKHGELKPNKAVSNHTFYRKQYKIQ